MAGDSDSTLTVLQWIVDYFLYRDWNEFNAHSQITEGDKDVLQGLFGILKESDTFPAKGALKQKWLFLVVMCRLADGEDVTCQFEEDSEETPLEYMVTPFQKLVDLQETPVKEEGENLLSDIKAEILERFFQKNYYHFNSLNNSNHRPLDFEPVGYKLSYGIRQTVDQSDIKIGKAVLACCRAGAFNRAKLLLNTEWKPANLDTEQKNTRKILKTIVRAENTQDETLQSYSYSQFLGVMKKYLEKIFKGFQKPLLLEAVEKKVASEKSLGEAEKNGRKRRLVERNFKADTIKKSQNKENAETSPSGHNRAKLRKLWSRNVTELFEPPESSESEDETDKMPPPLSPSPKKDLVRKKSLEPKKGQLSTAQSKKESPTSTTAEKLSTSCTEQQTAAEEGSGNMTYKKNVGRPNRHEPEQSNQQGNKIPWDMESLNFSVCSARTSRTKWTEDEMEDFFDAVQKFGVGNWRKIADYLNTERTNVMLKDKWRNMVKNGDAEGIAKKKGKKK